MDGRPPLLTEPVSEGKDLLPASVLGSLVAGPGSEKPTVRAVIFDLWDTLVPYPAAVAARLVAAMAEPLAVPAEAFATLWQADFDGRATGEIAESLHRVCRSLGVTPSGQVVADILSRRLAVHRASFTPRPDAVTTLGEVRALGLSVGLISDCSSETPELWAESPLASLVDVAVFSCIERVKKPDPRIFERACTRLGVTAGECVYVGDGASNELAGATTVGMRAVQLRTGAAEKHHWEGESISALGEVVPLVLGAI